MKRRRRRWDPPLSGPCLHLGPSMSEMISDDDKAGIPLPPLVELTPRSPPLTISEMHPLPPEPPEPPFSRDGTLAGVQVGFTSLTDDELRVARLWLIGVEFDDVCDKLGLPEKEVRRLWREMRRKLRAGLIRND